ICFMNKFKYFVEGRIFGVCSFIGEKLGIAPGIIRLYFIYLAFISMSSPIIIYLVLAFWINIKKYLVRKKNPVWE
ncbi:MAG: PspC domain-containing protein, partial [Chitinophagales bacterium]|nr:PspC domain-containing protein [Chitinophagales bacterium]